MLLLKRLGILLTLYFACCTIIQAQNQNLMESRSSSVRTFIYILTTEEAKIINNNENWNVDSSFFYTLVDTYPTDSIYRKILPPGHCTSRYSMPTMN